MEHVLLVDDSRSAANAISLLKRAGIQFEINYRHGVGGELPILYRRERGRWVAYAGYSAIADAVANESGIRITG